ncbi:hypothetical protein Naga_102462g1 [Nannochloropsis gaditana]|uniref:Uncharacterized protein n=1 Tax=Nannochloropsis gaditana TaxID=72520 RepID=W7T938_9STRA|nr:hypothetical protein Naga_102462g1 [Nannochloropsis gaditana]
MPLFVSCVAIRSFQVFIAARHPKLFSLMNNLPTMPLKPRLKEGDESDSEKSQAIGRTAQDGRGDALGRSALERW